MDDLLRIFHVALLNPHFRGVYNAVSPTPVQNHEFSSILAGKVNRPGVCSVPGGVLNFLLGKMANESLLASQRVLPQRLTESGIQFDFPTLDLAFVPFIRQALKSSEGAQPVFPSYLDSIIKSNENSILHTSSACNMVHSLFETGRFSRQPVRLSCATAIPKACFPVRFPTPRSLGKWSLT